MARRLNQDWDDQDSREQLAGDLMAIPQGRLLIGSLAVTVVLAFLAFGVWRGCQATRSPSVPPSQGTTASVGGGTLRIATWNLEQFSRNRKALDLAKMAQVIVSSHFDVLACQEIKSDGSRVDELLNTLHAPWRATSVSPLTGNNERFVFLYDGTHAAEVGKSKPIDVPEGEFDRHPYQATFQSGSFSFTLITCHLFYGKTLADHERRAREMQSLAAYAQRLSSVDSSAHIMVLGDFNEQKARPNLHYFTDLGWKGLITDQTNLGAIEVPETLDNIVINPRQTTQWMGLSGSVHYDVTMFNNDSRAAKEQVSDHRPAFADFRTR